MPIATAVYGHGGTIWWPIAVAIVALGVFFALGPARQLASYAVGVATSACALVAAFFAFLLTGCIGTNGHIDDWMWATGVAVIVVGCAWAVLRPQRMFWALPVATFSGLLVTDILALAVNGSTGWCPD